MFLHPSVHRELLRQRHQELVAAAERHRIAKASADRKGRVRSVSGLQTTRSGLWQLWYDTEYDTQYYKWVEHDVSVPHALLALLSGGPKYGLRLQQEFESRTGEVWPLNVGQVYTTLQRLERDGLVETDEGEAERSQKRYRITADGSRELANWLRNPPDLVPPPRDELVIKVLVGLQVPGIDVHELLQVHRRHVIEVMQRYTRIKAAAAEDDVGLALVADAELFRLEAIVRWLDAADVRLKRLAADRPATAPDLSLEPTRPMEVSQ